MCSITLLCSSIYSLIKFMDPSSYSFLDEQKAYFEFGMYTLPCLFMDLDLLNVKVKFVSLCILKEYIYILKLLKPNAI